MSDPVHEALIEGEQAGLRYALEMPRRARAARTGSTLGQRAGSSLDFKDYREYQPGDDLRHIDWNAYARSDQLTVKLFREEIAPHADLLLDVTRSMALTDSAKARAALALTAFFASAARNGGFSHAVWTLGEQVRPVPNGQSPPPLWEEINLEARIDPTQALLHEPPTWRSHGIRVLISDLLWEGDPLSVLRTLTQGASMVVIVQVLARADVEPPEPGNYRLIDSETNEMREVHVDANVAQRYRDALERHQELWDRSCRQVGAILTPFVAESLLESWRMDELVASGVLGIDA